MKKSAIKSVFLTLALSTTVTGVLAQTGAVQKRLIDIQGTLSAASNMRTGPWNYTGNVTGTVSTLKIKSQQASLTAPSGQALVEAKGKRTATFGGNVQVTRGRLTAGGEKLVYSEADGTGILTGGAQATFVPEKKEDGDTVSIKATQMSLDVDNNMSTSTGSVSLTNGAQSGKADKLVFDEDKELAQLTGTPSLTRAAKGSRKELTITGQEVRALTKAKTLYVKGKVKLVQGNLTTTGDAVYYDDKKDVAYVVGNAVAVQGGVKQVAPASGYLEQRTDRASVRVMNAAYKIPTQQFEFSKTK